MLDDIPVNNVDIFEIENNLCQIYSKKIFDMEHSNTYIYKTSYKRNVLNEINGEKTFYKMLLMKGTANEETD